MNKVILIGRLTKDPEIRYDNKGAAVARYRLAVDRQFRKNDHYTADFISCVAFGKAGEFAEKFLNKGTKIAVEGRIQTGSYDDKDGKKVYTVDVIVDRHEFVESKGAESSKESANDDVSLSPQSVGGAGFQEVDDDDGDWPF